MRPRLVEEISFAEIPISLQEKNVKRFNLTIRADGTVHLSVPRGSKPWEIEKFLEQRREWLIRNYQAMMVRSQRRVPLVITGQTVPVWGEEILIHAGEGRLPGGGAMLHLVEGRLVLEGGSEATNEMRERALQAFYLNETRLALSPLLQDWAPRVGVTVGGVRVRQLRSRWGSCSPLTGMLSFNSELAKYPPEMLEYVTVHELVHYLVPHHGREFQRIMTTLLPDWRTRRRTLNRLAREAVF